MLATLGGSPAALLAQRRLRHKSSKRSFIQALWTVIAIQALALTAVLLLR